MFTYESFDVRITILERLDDCGVVVRIFVELGSKHPKRHVCPNFDPERFPHRKQDAVAGAGDYLSVKVHAGAHLHPDVPRIGCPANSVGMGLQYSDIFSESVSGQAGRQPFQVSPNWIEFEKIVRADITHSCTLVGHRCDEAQRL